MNSRRAWVGTALVLFSASAWAHGVETVIAVVAGAAVGAGVVMGCLWSLLKWKRMTGLLLAYLAVVAVFALEDLLGPKISDESAISVVLDSAWLVGAIGALPLVVSFLATYWATAALRSRKGRRGHAP